MSGSGHHLFKPSEIAKGVIDTSPPSVLLLALKLLKNYHFLDSHLDMEQPSPYSHAVSLSPQHNVEANDTVTAWT